MDATEENKSRKGDQYVEIFSAAQADEWCTPREEKQAIGNLQTVAASVKCLDTYDQMTDSPPSVKDCIPMWTPSLR